MPYRIAVMSDEPLTAALHDEVNFVVEPAQLSGRLPRRFASPCWFGDAGVAATRVRPPLWRRARPARFLARLRQRLAWMETATRH